MLNILLAAHVILVEVCSGTGKLCGLALGERGAELWVCAGGEAPRGAISSIPLPNFHHHLLMVTNVFLNGIVEYGRDATLMQPSYD